MEEVAEEQDDSEAGKKKRVTKRRMVIDQYLQDEVQFVSRLKGLIPVWFFFSLSVFPFHH